MGRYGLYGPYQYDYQLNYPSHQCVIINSYQCECLAISVYVWQSEYVLECVREYVLAYIQSFFFFFCITQIILIVVCFCGQINPQYDV